mmetsp:Transcript_47120/g.98802  ORF Transcript_47120/g.98802 Transcript_47120/m.98802 type:complete len:85 (+) Transcript_47120:171-425(+)
MKACTVFFAAASVASAAAFVPAGTSSQQSSTQLNESFFKKISNLDLWAPVVDSNNYGARGKKEPQDRYSHRVIVHPQWIDENPV